jgi:integrase
MVPAPSWRSGQPGRAVLLSAGGVAGLDGLRRKRGAADAALPLFVGLSKAGRPSGAQLSARRCGGWCAWGGEDAGLEGWARFSGHSLRAGLATAAGEAGADLAQVMRQTRHRSAEVAMGYLRPAEIWRQI